MGAQVRANKSSLDFRSEGTADESDQFALSLASLVLRGFETVRPMSFWLHTELF